MEPMLQVGVQLEVLIGEMHGGAVVAPQQSRLWDGWGVGCDQVGLQSPLCSKFHLADGAAQAAAAAAFAVKPWLLLIILIIVLHLGLIGVLKAIGVAGGLLVGAAAALSLAALLAAAAIPAVGQPLLRTSLPILVVCPLVAVHVAVGGECLPADLAGEGPLPGVDQHVAVQGAEGGQHLPAQAAVVHLRLT